MEKLCALVGTTLLSFVATRAVLLMCRRFNLGQDSVDKVQRLHVLSTPRVGGLGIFAAFTVGCFGYAAFDQWSCGAEIARFWLVVLPVFLIGFLEDLRGTVGVRLRLLATMVAAGVGIVLLGALIKRIDVPWADDWILSGDAVAVAFTVLAAAGVPHALNMIDGCNGLASSTAACALIGIACLALKFNDTLLVMTALISAGAIIGFMFWNFPYGKIFLGDSGAYWSGFVVAELSILLVARHHQISAWAPMLMVVYPVWETLFTSLRRLRRGWHTVFQPDARHMHQLIYRRLSRLAPSSPAATGGVRTNSVTSVPFAAWSMVAVFLAYRYSDEPDLLRAQCAGFAAFYVLGYRTLARMRPVRRGAAKVATAPLPLVQEPS